VSWEPYSGRASAGSALPAAGLARADTFLGHERGGSGSVFWRVCSWSDGSGQTCDGAKKWPSARRGAVSLATERLLPARKWLHPVGMVSKALSAQRSARWEGIFI